MNRACKRVGLALGFIFLLQMILANPLWALRVIESKIFRDGPYVFKMEVQVYGPQSLKKNPLKITSLKVKIKNTRESSTILRVQNIRVRPEPQIFQDIETKGYPISPGQWVTKYYRLPKGNQPILREGGSIEIIFDNFTIMFDPRSRKFQGPSKS